MKLQCIDQQLNQIIDQKDENPFFRQKKRNSHQFKKAALQLKRILDEDQQPHSKFKQVMAQVCNCETEEQLVDLFLNYANRKIAKNLANRFLFAFDKLNRKAPTIQLFYQELTKKKVSIQNIEEIRHFISTGKRQRVRNKLNILLGEIDGGAAFDKYQSQFSQKFAQPIEGSQKLKQKNGLDIYKYPKIQISQFQQATAKTLIVFGQTGCGKSTVLNSLTNYLSGVEYQDPFRYFLIVENAQSQLKSITKDISIYYVKDIRTGVIYRVIDTPGFGDTDGIERDKEMIKNVQNLFRTQIDSLHLVLFLMKSSITRVTAFQYYVFQTVMDLFDISIAENFVFVLTFADASKPVVLENIMDEQTGFGAHWDQIVEPKHIEVNNSGFFQKNLINAQITENFWKAGSQFLSKLIKKAECIHPKSLQVTKVLIKKKQELSTKIKITCENIQNFLIMQQNIRKQIQSTVQNQQKLKSNQKFTYFVEVQQYYAQKVSFNVTRCNNCLNSNCHSNCAYGDGQSKIKCSSIGENEYCLICPKHCHYVTHTNDHYLRKLRNVQEERTNEEVKSKYKDAKDKVNWYEKQIEKLLRDYDKSIHQTQKCLKQMIKLQQQLYKYSMSKSKPLSVKAYAEYLIQNERKNKKVGYKQKIQQLQRTIQQMQAQQNIIKGIAIEENKKIRKKLFQSLLSDEKIGKSSLFDKLTKFFASLFHI